MQSTRILRYISGAALLVSVRSTAAQSPVTVAADASIGGTYGAGSVYRNRGGLALRLAVSLRGPRMARVTWYAGVLAERTVRFGSNANCAFRPRGGCLQNFPHVAGAALTVGVLVRPIAVRLPILEGIV